MRKEILLAIVTGVVFGIILAFGIWRANSALKSTAPESKAEQAQAPTPSPDVFEVALVRPDNYDVITSSPATIEGITAPSSWVSISSEDEDYIIKANKEGVFEQQVSLTGGINQILVTAFNEKGESVVEKRLIVYSTEFPE